MKLVLTVLATLALLAGTAVGAAATATPSAVSVTPAHGLVNGEVVHVSATGITPSATVQVVQCGPPDGDPADVCPAVTTTTASSSGAVSLHMAVASLVYRAQEIGDSVPVYCRADGCQIFLEWTDATGEPQVISSQPLEFAGAPARIHARPANNLADSQTIRVNGSAYGAFGHKVEVLEEACYRVSQGSGCYGALPAVTTYVQPDGTFAVKYPASRFLSDGTDCAASDNLGQCEMTVIVFNHGQPDDSFGVSSIGQPLVLLNFAGTPG